MPLKLGRHKSSCTCRTPRSKRLTCLFLIETALQAVNLVFYISPNVYALCKPFGFFYSAFISWCRWARWTCWNTVCHHASSHVSLSLHKSWACPHCVPQHMMPPVLSHCYLFCHAAQVSPLALPVVFILCPLSPALHKLMMQLRLVVVTCHSSGRLRLASLDSNHQINMHWLVLVLLDRSLLAGGCQPVNGWHCFFGMTSQSCLTSCPALAQCRIMHDS